MTIFPIYKVQEKWNTCSFALEASGHGEMAYQLKKYGMSESYNCSNLNIIASGEYYMPLIRYGNDSYQKVARLCEIIISEELKHSDFQYLREKIKLALDKSCNNCNFYRPIEMKNLPP